MPPDGGRWADAEAAAAAAAANPTKVLRFCVLMSVTLLRFGYRAEAAAV